MMFAICVAITIASLAIMDWLAFRRVTLQTEVAGYVFLLTFGVFIPAATWTIYALIIQG